MTNETPRYDSDDDGGFDLPSGASFDEDGGDPVIRDSNGNIILRYDEGTSEWQFQGEDLTGIQSIGSNEINTESRHPQVVVFRDSSGTLHANGASDIGEDTDLGSLLNTIVGSVNRGKIALREWAPDDDVTMGSAVELGSSQIIEGEVPKHAARSSEEDLLSGEIVAGSISGPLISDTDQDTRQDGVVNGAGVRNLYIDAGNLTGDEVIQFEGEHPIIEGCAITKWADGAAIRTLNHVARIYNNKGYGGTGPFIRVDWADCQIVGNDGTSSGDDVCKIDAANNTLRGNTFSDSGGGSGLRMLSGATECRVVACHVGANDQRGYYDQGENNTYASCTADATGDGSNTVNIGLGWWVRSSPGTVLHGCTALDNESVGVKFEGSTKCGMYGGYVKNNGQVSGKSERDGIKCVNADDIQIVGVQVYDDQGTTTQQNGIRFDDCSGALVAGCVVTGHANADILIDSDNDEIVITNTQFGTITDNGTRTLINGHGTNNGDPASTGDWNGEAAYAHDMGAVVWDTSTTPDTPYLADPDGSWHIAAVEPDALTAKDTGTVDGTYGTPEADVIKNNRTRIEEIEDRLGL